MSKKYITPLEMLYKWEKEIPNSIFLRQPVDDFWHEWTWHDSVNEVRKMSAYLLSLNLLFHYYVILPY